MREDERNLCQQAADALRWAREQSGMSPDEFAFHLDRIVRGPRRLTGNMLTAMEHGAPIDACYLIAASRVIGQPVSSILREMPIFEHTIPELERRLARLEAMQHGERWQKLA